MKTEKLKNLQIETGLSLSQTALFATLKPDNFPVTVISGRVKAQPISYKKLEGYKLVEPATNPPRYYKDTVYQTETICNSDFELQKLVGHELREKNIIKCLSESQKNMFDKYVKQLAIV